MGGKRERKKKSDAASKVAELKKAQENPSEIDFETLIREEYSKLHRQYRLMENASHAIHATGGKLSKQGRLLMQLRDEKESLKTDLANATCTAYQQRDKNTIKTILGALEKYEKYKNDSARCLADMAEMEENVDKITKRLVDQKLKAQAIWGQAMTVSHADKVTRILENRLYHVTTQFDTTVSNNNQLKEEINMMLRLRGQFYRRLISIKLTSSSIKSKMGGVVYEASQAYEQRDDWVNKIALLKEKNDKDSRQHVLEIKEFDRVLHHDSKMHDFMQRKNEERKLLENHKQRIFRKNTGKVNELNALLEAYHRAFNFILRISLRKDVDSIVSNYLQDEQKNYAVFKYVTDLNHEVHWLKQDIDNMKMEIEKLNEENRKREEDYEKELVHLEDMLVEEKINFNHSLQEWKAADSKMEIFAKLLDQTFHVAECSNQAIISLLGNSAGLVPSNICLCMGVLERRLTELMVKKGTLEVRQAVEVDQTPLPKKTQYWQPGVKPKPTGGPFKPKILITGRLDTEQDEDDQDSKLNPVVLPTYYKEIKVLAMEHMNTDTHAQNLETDPSLMSAKMSYNYNALLGQPVSSNPNMNTRASDQPNPVNPPPNPTNADAPKEN